MGSVEEVAPDMAVGVSLGLGQIGGLGPAKIGEDPVPSTTPTDMTGDAEFGRGLVHGERYRRVMVERPIDLSRREDDEVDRPNGPVGLPKVFRFHGPAVASRDGRFLLGDSPLALIDPEIARTVTNREFDASAEFRLYRREFGFRGGPEDEPARAGRLGRRRYYPEAALPLRAERVNERNVTLVELAAWREWPKRRRYLVRLNSHLTSLP